MDKTLTKDELISMLREQIRQAGSQKKWALAHGLSEQYLSDVLHGRREVTDGKLLEALGYRRIVLYEKAEAA